MLVTSIPVNIFNIWICTVLCSRIYNIILHSSSIVFVDSILSTYVIFLIYKYFSVNDSKQEEKEKKIAKALKQLTQQLNDILDEAQQNENRIQEKIKQVESDLTISQKKEIEQLLEQTERCSIHSFFCVRCMNSKEDIEHENMRCDDKEHMFKCKFCNEFGE